MNPTALAGIVINFEFSRLDLAFRRWAEMKSVLISIKPKWCEKIASREKTIEVRKTAPKCEVPFKCYIYCTKNNRAHALHLYINGGYGRQEIGIIEHWRSGKEIVDVNPHLPAYRYNSYLAEGKVIGEFVCDEVDTYCCCDLGYEISEETFNKIMLTGYEFYDYGKRKTLRGWHISDLKIYDNPKELSEFVLPCRVSCENCKNPLYYARKCEEKGVKCITCPPQSWCYVEEL